MEYISIYSNWNPLYTFLQMIGEENRRSLRNLEIPMSKPKQCWQHSDGTRTSRTSLDNWRFRKVIPQSTYLQSYSTPVVEGPVDHLDPAIEACFRILGNDRPALRLTLILDEHFLPGVEMKSDPLQGDKYNFGLDVPIMIERLRQDLTSTSGAKSQVEVLWKGKCWSFAFRGQTELIQQCGWVILHAEKERIRRRSRATSTTVFTMRRKELSVTSLPVDIEAS